jgi:hypothetical protein
LSGALRAVHRPARWHAKTSDWRELAKQSPPSLVSPTAEYYRSGLFVTQFDWEYYVLSVCALAVIVVCVIILLAAL